MMFYITVKNPSLLRAFALEKCMIKNVGIAGCGALGSIVANALTEGVDGYRLTGISNLTPVPFDAPMMSFSELAENCDIIVECLPAASVEELAREVLSRGKVLIAISAAALMIYPEILKLPEKSSGRIIVPSGALTGMDGVMALKQAGITSAKIISTKLPKGFTGAPWVVQNNIDLESIKTRTLIFSGSALDAARAFPANVNVAATLSLAGIGPDKTTVEVWADPAAPGNSHEIEVHGKGSVMRAKVDNIPDPSNPKSSQLAGHSIVSVLKKLHDNITVL
jgi:aspartate dehydrogenase